MGLERKDMESNQEKYGEIVKRMEREAVEELLHYHEKDWKQKIKNIVKKAAGRYVPPTDVIFWPTGLLANALAENLNACEDRDMLLQALRVYFDRWITKGMPLHYVDDVLCGTALLILYEETGEEKYGTGAERMADYLLKLASEEADGAGSIPYRAAQKNKHIYVDGIGMMCPFLCRYGVRFGNAETVDIALTQIENMLEYGMDEKTGLPYHGFQYENGVKYGIIGWGRAVGWLLTGMAGAIKALSDEKALQLENSDNRRDRIRKLTEAFWKITEKVIPFQKGNGAFSWQLEAVEGPDDSSAAGMIAAAAGEGLAYTLPEDGNAEVRTACEKMCAVAAEYLAECEQGGKVYMCSGECGGFSQYPQIYGAYPWSLGSGIKAMKQQIVKGADDR